MEFYFDDSGDFALPKGGEEKVSLWIGVLVPEMCKASLERRYTEWEEEVRRRVGGRAEIKGSRLDLTSRELLFAALHQESDILIHPAIIDLQTQCRFPSAGTNKFLKELAYVNSEHLESEGQREQVRLHGRRIGNLSDEQILKFFTLTHCVIDSVRKAVLFRSHGQYRECWTDVHYWVDKSSTSPFSRDESVFRESLGWAVHHSTKREPIDLLEWIHTDQHPFVKNFVAGEKIDGKRLFKNISFEKSSNNWGLRLADVVANSMNRALEDLDDKRGELHLYDMIMEHSPLGPCSNLGFVVLTDGSVTEEIKLGRYAVLQQIIASRRR